MVFICGLLFNPLPDFIWVVLQPTSAVKSIVLFWFGDFGLEVSLSPKVLVYLGYFGLEISRSPKVLVCSGDFGLEISHSPKVLVSLRYFGSEIYARFFP